MTNEQKAVELMNSGVGMRPALELMAEWKDEQIIRILSEILDIIQTSDSKLETLKKIKILIDNESKD